MSHKIKLPLFIIAIIISHVLNPTIEQLSECLSAYDLSISSNRATLTKNQQADYDRCRQLAFTTQPH